MAKRKSRNAKRGRSYDRGSSNNRLEIQDKSRFKKWVSNHVPSKFPKARDEKGNNLRAKKGRSGNSPNEKPTCAKYGKGHLGECFVGNGNCISCGKSDQKMGVCPNMKGQERGGQAQTSGYSDTPMKNHFHALRSRGEQYTSPAW